MRHPLSLLILSLVALTVPALFAEAPGTTIAGQCPVQLSATRNGFGALVPTRAPDAASPTPQASGQSPEQFVELSVTNREKLGIVAAELDVHGTSNKARIMPADSSNIVLTTQPAGDAVRHVHLASTVPAGEERTSTVSAQDMTSISWISVTGLSFADGSTWHASPGTECRVIPDGMMLIAGK